MKDENDGRTDKKLTFTHLDNLGNSRMVEVGDKPISDREAVAEGFIGMTNDTLAMIKDGRFSKGDVLMVAQLAGIVAAKRTSEWIPLCHPIPLTGLDVTLEIESKGVRVRAVARAHWRTGVEMEALTAVSATLLTIYDMVKSVDRSLEMGEIRLLEKRGGRSGEWLRHPKV
jgi:cyclic pyranopterin phosphate synthase